MSACLGRAHGSETHFGQSSSDESFARGRTAAARLHILQLLKSGRPRGHRLLMPPENQSWSVVEMEEKTREGSTARCDEGSLQGQKQLGGGRGVSDCDRRTCVNAGRQVVQVVLLV